MTILVVYGVFCLQRVLDTTGTTVVEMSHSDVIITLRDMCRAYMNVIVAKMHEFIN